MGHLFTPTHLLERREGRNPVSIPKRVNVGEKQTLGGDHPAGGAPLKTEIEHAKAFKDSFDVKPRVWRPPHTCRKSRVTADFRAGHH